MRGDVLKSFNRDGINHIVLKPGELYFGKGPALVHTLLGSCVAITLWNRKTKMGGMCHYALASRENYQKNDHHQLGHYGTDAIDFFKQQSTKHGLKPDEFEVKLFGGGNMFEGIHNRPDVVNVARSNIVRGRQMLEEFGFVVNVEDVGGVRYRKIYFELTSGDVWVQYGKHSKTCQ
ncbi:MAG: chemotaxis protein CheD [Oleispira sp.]